jgi:HEPN domain-containing protein
MVDKEIIREWMMKAYEDFAFALVNQLEGRPFTAQICFHFQQAAEKYLKACIVSFDLAFLKTHDLPVLLRLLCDKDPSFSQIKSECESRNAFYISTRYPVHWLSDFSQDTARKSHAATDRIRLFINEKLK